MTADSYPQVLLALTLWREARGRSHVEKLAIAHVIYNRYKAGGKTLVDVLVAPAQFTSISPPHSVCLNEWINATSWPVMRDVQWGDCCSIADTIISGASVDPTGGATHYYSDPIDRIPDWADPTKITATIGVFHFFKL